MVVSSNIYYSYSRPNPVLEKLRVYTTNLFCQLDVGGNWIDAWIMFSGIKFSFFLQGTKYCVMQKRVETLSPTWLASGNTGTLVKGLFPHIIIIFILLTFWWRGRRDDCWHCHFSWLSVGWDKEHLISSWDISVFPVLHPSRVWNIVSMSLGSFQEKFRKMSGLYK